MLDSTSLFISVDGGAILILNKAVLNTQQNEDYPKGFIYNVLQYVWHSQDARLC